MVLILSDCHGVTPVWPEVTPNALLLLGDNGGIERLALKRYPGIPAFGVPGNHDGLAVYEGLPVQNIHGKVIEFNGLRIGGLGGCLRYKDGGRYPWLFTEQQYRDILTQMSPADIFISHVPPAGAPGSDLSENNGLKAIVIDWISPRNIYDAHEGSTSLRRFIMRTKPKLLFYGHLHQEDRYQIGKTQVISVFEAYNFICLKNED